MKLSTAIKNALQVASRIHSLNGLIGTPASQFECYRIKRAWVFGSTIKGKDFPGDLDIILESIFCGRRYSPHNRGSEGKTRLGAKTDKNYLKRFGIRVAQSSDLYAHRMLSEKMKMVRIHDFSIDERVAHPRIMIYPRNDFKKWAESPRIVKFG